GGREWWTDRHRLSLPGGRHLGLGFCFYRIGLMNGLLQSLDRLAKPFPKLGELPRPKNDQHNDQDQNQLCKPDASKHSGIVSFVLNCRRLSSFFRPFSKTVFELLPSLLGLLEHLALLIGADQVIVDQWFIRMMLNSVLHHFNGKVRLLVVESNVHQLKAGVQMFWVQLKRPEITLHRYVDRVVI